MAQAMSYPQQSSLQPWAWASGQVVPQVVSEQACFSRMIPLNPSDCVVVADVGERCAGTASKLLICSPHPRANVRSRKLFCQLLGLAASDDARMETLS